MNCFYKNIEVEIGDAKSISKAEIVLNGHFYVLIENRMH